MARETAPLPVSGVPPMVPSPNDQVEPAIVQGMAEWEQMSRHDMIPGPTGVAQQVERIALKPGKTVEKASKEKKKKIIYNWTRSVWIRRAMKNREQLKENARESKTATGRGFWKLADFAVGLALNRPNQIMKVPANKANKIKGFSPDDSGKTRNPRLDY
jgi:hypothetical protein